MFEIGIAMAMNCFILNLYYRNYEMPPWVRSLVLGRLAKIVRVDVPLRNIADIFADADCSADLNKNHPVTVENLENAVNKGILSKENDTLLQEVSYYATSITLEEFPNSAQNQHKKFVTIDERLSPVSKPKTKTNFQSKKKNQSKIKRDMGEDWRLVARIVDRLMLFLSVVIGVVSAVTIFMQTDRFKKLLYG